MRVRTVARLAVVLALASGASAGASTADGSNPFRRMDPKEVLLATTEVRVVRHGLVELQHTKDTIALDAIDSEAMTGPIGDGRYFMVIPFWNAAHAEHAALVFAGSGTTAKLVGGFAAKRDHLVISVSNTIDVDFFAQPSNGKTLAAGGPAPTSTQHIVVSGSHLAIANQTVAVSRT